MSKSAVGQGVKVLSFKGSKCRRSRGEKCCWSRRRESAVCQGMKAKNIPCQGRAGSAASWNLCRVPGIMSRQREVSYCYRPRHLNGVLKVTNKELVQTWFSIYLGTGAFNTNSTFTASRIFFSSLLISTWVFYVQVVLAFSFLATRSSNCSSYSRLQLHGYISSNIYY